MGYKTKSFHIDIAGITFLVTLEGEVSQHLYKRLKKAFIEFISKDKKPHRRIKISTYPRGRDFDFIQKGKTLKVLISNKLIKNKSLWRMFLDILTKRIRDSVLSYPNIILLHAAACAKNNNGYLFLGPSKSGKTTVTKLLKGYSVLSDDKILIKPKGKKYCLYQLPLLSYESKKLQKNIGASIFIDKIFLLRKSSKIQFKKVSRTQALANLLEGSKELNRIFKPDIRKVFDISYGIAGSIPTYEMYFKKDDSLEDMPFSRKRMGTFHVFESLSKAK